MFFKIIVLKNFVNFTGEHLCWRLLLIKLLAWGPVISLKETSTQVISCEICEVFKNTFFYRTPPVIAFVDSMQQYKQVCTLSLVCVLKKKRKHYLTEGAFNYCDRTYGRRGSIKMRKYINREKGPCQCERSHIILFNWAP